MQSVHLMSFQTAETSILLYNPEAHCLPAGKEVESELSSDDLLL
jgi:hypothetical protein